MKNNYTAVMKQDGNWWLGWIEEIPGVNCQETSHDELIESLKVTLQEALAFLYSTKPFVLSLSKNKR